MNIEPMISTSGNNLINQFTITTDNGVYFQSYKSVIAFKPNDGSPIQLGKNWDYSNTTGIYRNQFLGEKIAATRAKIADGTYIINKDLKIK